MVVVAGAVWYVRSQSYGQVQGVATASWMFDGTTWRVSGKPPTCPSPLTLVAPVDLKKATAILYPGQSRGGNYKPHGGFRFDKSKNTDIKVKAPMDAVVVEGSRYLEGGEVQYMFSFINPCGIMYRFDHLHTLAPKLAALAEKLPAPKNGDSRTTPFNSGVAVTAEEVVATAVGFPKSNNTSVDWGVYDLRNKNAAAQNPSFAAQHDNQQAEHALCWFDVLSAGDKASVKKLPAGDAKSGKKSDYCR